MPKSATVRNLLITAIIAAGALTTFYFWQGTEQQVSAPTGPPASVISSTTVIEESWQPVLKSVGSVVAVNGIDISTEVNGIVSDIMFQSGQAVESGEVLLELDNSVDKAGLEALQADQALAEVQFRRVEGLLKKSVTSKSEFDEAEARLNATHARVKQQEAIIKRKIIRAPFAGLAGIRKVSLGEFIEIGDAIVSLQQLDPIYIDYTLAERHTAKIMPGQDVTATFDAVPGQSFNGKVAAIDSGIDTGTRTLKVRATFSNPDGLLRPGMFAQVETLTGEARPVLTLPRTALSFNTYGNFVFVIEQGEDGSHKVRRTTVTTGEIRNGRVAIDNLEAGSEVVRTGLVKLRDGSEVKIDNSIELDDTGIRGE